MDGISIVCSSIPKIVRMHILFILHSLQNSIKRISLSFNPIFFLPWTLKALLHYYKVYPQMPHSSAPNKIEKLHIELWFWSHSPRWGGDMNEWYLSCSFIKVLVFDLSCTLTSNSSSSALPMSCSSHLVPLQRIGSLHTCKSWELKIQLQFHNMALTVFAMDENMSMTASLSSQSTTLCFILTIHFKDSLSLLFILLYLLNHLIVGLRLVWSFHCTSMSIVISRYLLQKSFCTKMESFNLHSPLIVCQEMSSIEEMS